eukprot:c17344_g1_i1 orf=227-1150(+)
MRPLEKKLHRHNHHLGYLSLPWHAMTLYGFLNTHALRQVHHSGAIPMQLVCTQSIDEAHDTVSNIDADNLWCMHQQGKLIPIEILKRHLQQCANRRDLRTGRQAYSVMLVNGSDTLGALGSYFIHVFSLCGCLLEANLVFSQIKSPCIVSWHAIIEAHTLLCQTEKAIDLYLAMQEEGVLPSKSTVLCILGACTKERQLSYGRLINHQVIRNGQSSDVALMSCLVDLYAKCGSIAEAQKVFDNLPSRNVVTWNALIGGYATAGEIANVMSNFEKMKEEKVRPEKVTFLCVMKACNALGALEPVFETL